MKSVASFFRLEAFAFLDAKAARVEPFVVHPTSRGVGPDVVVALLVFLGVADDLLNREVFHAPEAVLVLALVANLALVVPARAPDVLVRLLALVLLEALLVNFLVILEDFAVGHGCCFPTERSRAAIGWRGSGVRPFPNSSERKGRRARPTHTWMDDGQK